MSGHEQRPGDWRIICARSGRKCWASDTVIDGQSGHRVHRRFADQRHPQELVRAVPDKGAVPFANSPGTDVFITTRITAADL